MGSTTIALLQKLKMIYYILTVLNILLCLASMAIMLKMVITYNIARRWNVYIIYLLTVLIGVVMVSFYSLFVPNGKWQWKIVTTTIALSSIYFSYCLKYSSIRKN